MKKNIKITVLGSGTSVGIPALGSLGWGKCDPTNVKNRRQRCAILIESQDTTILIDAGPDIKNQLIEHNIKKIDAVFITHQHSDHIAGLDELRPFYFYNKNKIIRGVKSVERFDATEYYKDYLDEYTTQLINKAQKQNKTYSPAVIKRFQAHFITLLNAIEFDARNNGETDEAIKNKINAVGLIKV